MVIVKKLAGKNGRKHDENIKFEQKTNFCIDMDEELCIMEIELIVMNE